MAKKIHLKVGKRYFNTFVNQEFTVLKVDRPNDKIVIEKDGETLERTYSLIQGVVQKMKDDQMSGFEQNLGDDGWTIFLQDASGADEIFARLGENYQEPLIPDEWIDADNYWFYRIPANSTKGAIARKMYLGLKESQGASVERNKETGDYGQPEVDGQKKLIKVACIKEDSTVTFNNFRQGEDWEDAVFVCVYPEKIEIFEISKADFIDYLEAHPKEIMWSGHTALEDRDIRTASYFHWVTEENFLMFNKV